MSQEEINSHNQKNVESNEVEPEEINEKPDIPLFMEDKTDSPQGNEQDEKDKTEE